MLTPEGRLVSGATRGANSNVPYAIGDLPLVPGKSTGCGGMGWRVN